MDISENAQDTVPKEFIVMMAVLMSVVAISIDAMLPALGIIGKELKVSHPNHAQYIISSIFIGMAIGQLVCGMLSDALGRKKVLYGGLFVYIAGSVFCLTADNIITMLVGRFIQGLGVSGPYISCMSIVRDKFSGRSMAKIMSLVMMIFIMVPVVAPALGQTIVTMASWQYIFIFYIIYAVGIMIWTTFRLEETLPLPQRIPFKFSTIIYAIRAVVNNKQTMVYAACMGFVFAALIGDLNSIQQVFQVQFGVGKMFVVYFGLQALGFGVSSLINSRLVEKLGMRYICLRALVVLLSSSVIFLVAHFIVPIQFWMYFIYGVILLFCVGLLFGNLNALALEPMGHIAGIASAVIGALSNLISIPLGTIIGQLYDGTLLPVVAGFSILSIMAIIMIIMGGREHRVAY